MKRILILAALILAACAPAATQTPPTVEPVAPTETKSPASTITPTPTWTRRATSTRGPTRTPAPTNTPAPPTPTPAPVVLTGSGDSVVDFDGSICPCVARITGNAASAHFAVKSHDRNGDLIELLVNTTDPYDGRVPIDFLDSENTTRLEVTARGDWTITVIALENYDSEGRLLTVPGTIEGSGDDVIILLGDDPDTAIIGGNADARYFAVIAWGRGGRDLLVNTTDVYSGQVIMPRDALLLQVKAEGKWTIDVKGR